MSGPGSAEEIVVVTRRLDGPVPYPLALLGTADRPQDDVPQAAWAAPDDDVLCVARGAAHSLVAEGADRLLRLGSACREARGRIRWQGALDDAARPRWFGGFAFSDGAAPEPWSAFPAAWLFLPEVLLVQGADSTWLTLAAEGGTVEDLEDASRAVELALRRALPPPEDTLPRAEGLLDIGSHKDRVVRALAIIVEGKAEKVVVANRRTLVLGGTVEPAQVLSRMAAAEPGCFQFLVAPNGGSALVGASPERLVAVAGDRLKTVALAGSAPRGATREEDDALAKALLGSVKDREEHAHVVRALKLALAGYDVKIPVAPRIRRLARLHHLETPIEAVMPEKGDCLEVAALLHPTPALAGSPTAAALEVIAAVEPESRGWYGGAVGWTDGRGAGEFAVVIRSLLVRGNQVNAFAGAGLVAASDADEEVREIDMKLEATFRSAGLAAPAPGPSGPARANPEQGDSQP